MLQKITHNKLLFIGIHILFGYLATFSFFPKIYTLAIFIIGFIVVALSSNLKEESLYVASYIVGAEVFFRMTGGAFLYETGKYGVIVFLVIGMLVGPFKQKTSLFFLLYILLLLLGIVFTAVPEGESLRKAIAFNLSGPIVLGITGIYLYKRPITKKELFDILFFMLLPLFSMVTYLYFRTPDLKEIVFGGAANFATSGGFGPNQVATAIGLGIFILGVFILEKRKLTGFLFLDVLFLAYFFYRGLLTFSRGGIITGVVAFAAFVFFYILSQKKSLKIFFTYLVVGLSFSLAIWTYTSNVTKGMLDNRYAGKNAKGIKKEDISSGRIAIMEEQFRSFMENPMGIGVGNGKYKRKFSGKHVTAAAHNEIGRLVEEHGIIGFFLLIMLLLIPLFHFWNATNYQRAFLVSFYLLWFLTINHSAMRIAFPGFIYGLSLINITDDES